MAAQAGYSLELRVVGVRGRCRLRVGMRVRGERREGGVEVRARWVWWGGTWEGWERRRNGRGDVNWGV